VSLEASPFLTFGVLGHYETGWGFSQQHYGITSSMPCFCVYSLYINGRQGGLLYSTGGKNDGTVRMVFEIHGAVLKMAIVVLLIYAHASCQNTHVLCGGKMDGTTWAG